MVAIERPLGHLFAELRRRHVFRVAAVYGAAVFGLLQVLSVVFPALLIPDWVMTVTVVVVLAGFPVAVALGWIFDLTPAGLQRTGPAPDAVPAAPADTLAAGQSVVVHRMERLDAMLAREGVLPLARAVDIVGQLASALEPDHRKGRPHGRIVPASIIVAPDRRGTDVVRLLEAAPATGMMAALGATGAMGTAAATGTTSTVAATGAMGTASLPAVTPPAWAAPEQLAGEAADARSDVYTLGLLLFRMLTGGDPHAGASSAQRAVARLTTPALRLRDVFPARRYPDGVQAVLDRALALRREDRPADACELRRQLVEAIDGERGYTGVFARLRPPREPGTDEPTGTPDAPAPGKTAHHGRHLSLGRVALLGTIVLGIAAIALRVSESLVARPAPAASNGPAAAPSPPAGAGPVRASILSPAEEQAPRPEPAVAVARHALAAEAHPIPPAALSLRLDAEGATLLLAGLSERSANHPTDAALAGVRDTAAAIWQDATLPPRSRAFAAFVAGNAQSALRDPASCAAWIQRALALDPKPEYQQLLRVCSDAARRLTRAP